MSTEQIYRVIVTREGDAWLADVPELEGAHTFARTLPALDRAVREVVVLAADRPDEDMPALRLAYDYREPCVNRPTSSPRPRLPVPARPLRSSSTAASRSVTSPPSSVSVRNESPSSPAPPRPADLSARPTACRLTRVWHD